MNTAGPLVLASRSPRRTALLDMVGIDHVVCVPNDEEARLFAPDERIAPERARAICRSLAEAKAAEVAARLPEREVLAADTIVVVDGLCFGKPADRADARRMLRMLAGRTHQVYTGVCLRQGEHYLSEAVATDVTFYPWSEELALLVDAYAESGAPLDKAGAYGIQDAGALLIERIEGDYYNVVGLPLSAFWRLRRQFWRTIGT